VQFFVYFQNFISSIFIFQLCGTNTSRPSDVHFGNKPSILPAATRAGSLASSGSILPDPPKSSLISTTAPSNRRVLLPFASQAGSTMPLSATVAFSSTGKTATQPSRGSPSATSVVSSGETGQKDSKDSTRTASLEYFGKEPSTGKTTFGVDTKRKFNKATMTEDQSSITKATAADISKESDLAWLYQQRSLIDKRISDLQENAQAPGEAKDIVMYINGYYCRACRKVFRGDYAAKMAHCQENAHLFNVDESNNDPETVFKYFEERYEGIAFDDDEEDNETATNSRTPSAVNSPEKWAHQQAGLMKSPSASSYPEKIADSDDEDEKESKCERFDRTRISRR